MYFHNEEKVDFRNPLKVSQLDDPIKNAEEQNRQNGMITPKMSAGD